MTDDANLDDGLPGDDDPKGLRRLLKEEKAAHKATKDQLAAMSGVAREHATLKAGLDLDEARQTAFWAVHGTQDLTPEALNATAMKLGFAKAPETTPPPATPNPGQPPAPGTPDANDPPQRDPFGRPAHVGINAASAGTAQGPDQDYATRRDAASGSKESIRDFLIQQGMLHTQG